MDDWDDSRINISSIRVAGVGGLGMIAMIGVIAYALPAVRWFVLVSLTAGVVGGLLLIAFRRVRPEPPHPPIFPSLLGKTRRESSQTFVDPRGRDRP